MGLLHFLLVYDLAEQRLVKQQVYENGDEAAAAYAALEKECGDEGDLEIVLVGAEDLETVQQTHSHYFTRGTASPYLAGT